MALYAIGFVVHMFVSVDFKICLLPKETADNKPHFLVLDTDKSLDLQLGLRTTKKCTSCSLVMRRMMRMMLH